MAATWDDNNDSSTPDKIEAVMALAGIAEGQKILDIGTGTGILLPYLAEHIGSGGSIMAVDMAEKMLKRAEEKYSGLTPSPSFMLGDVEHDPIPGRYDRIMLYCVFPHIHEPEKTLRRLADDNLLPGGEIIVAHPTSRHFINHVHGHRPIHSEGLAGGYTVADRLEKVGLYTDVIADGDTLYLLSIRPDTDLK